MVTVVFGGDDDDGLAVVVTHTSFKVFFNFNFNFNAIALFLSSESIPPRVVTPHDCICKTEPKIVTSTKLLVFATGI
ncbi:hypothetical protein LINGRAHAP2_LOCUS34644 [Linum grandiflorum]